MSKRHISVIFLLCLFLLFSMEVLLDAEPIVILKADDFKHDSSDPDSIPPRWERFIEFIYENEIKASIGVIGRYLVTGSTIFYEKLKNIHEEGSIELWNHGYTHILHGKNANNETYHEFWNQPFWAQKLSLELTNTLALACTGIKFRTFGAPGNTIDDVTLEAINSMDQLYLWFYGDLGSNKLILPRSIDAEHPCQNPDFNKFQEDYNTSYPSLIVLQLHPAAWDDARFSEFEKIIDFLLLEGAEFITPIDYYYYSPTVYENGEDLTTDNWYIYDDNPSGSVISNCFDVNRESNVISFSGSGTNNGYRLKKNGEKWYNTGQFIIEWSMCYSTNFIVYIDIKTTNGQRYIQYRPVDSDILGDGQYIKHGLGSNVKDGNWHTFTRNLENDLKLAQPDAEITEVNGFLIRGNGRVDDIVLYRE